MVLHVWPFAELHNIDFRYHLHTYTVPSLKYLTGILNSAGIYCVHKQEVSGTIQRAKNYM